MITLLFPRIERFALVNVAILRCEPDPDKFPDSSPDPEEVFQALRDALTRWARETRDGHEAWENSCQDFNVGDLTSLDCENSPDVIRLLGEHGIHKLTVECLSGEHFEHDYDAVLIHPDDSEPEQP